MIGNEGVAALDIDEAFIGAEGKAMCWVQFIDVVQDPIFDGEELRQIGGNGRNQSADGSQQAADDPGGAGAVGPQEGKRVIRSELNFMGLGTGSSQSAE